MAQTVGTCVVSNWERDTCLLHARAHMSRVLPTAVSPTTTHLTSSWWGCSLSITDTHYPTPPKINNKNTLFYINFFLEKPKHI